jgi:hypothetical protein
MLSFVVLVDMVNGYFAMGQTKLPVSQAFKVVLLVLFLLRLSGSPDIGFVLLSLLVFQIGPVSGLIKTGDVSVFLGDVIVATKWFIVPLSFFYFKLLFQSISFPEIEQQLSRVIKRSFGFISLNMFLGLLGFGMAFYNHGFGNAVGTKGFIYAGNELTIMVLAVGFIMAAFLYKQEAYKKFLLTFCCFLLFAFLITSKTVLGGVLIVFLIPVIGSIKVRIKQKWVGWIAASLILGIPVLIVAFYFGITRSGVMDKFRYSLERNDYDLLTVIVSNRNNFVQRGWEVYSQEYPLLGKIFGYGQQYHLDLSGHSAEVDFLSLLFASGMAGLLFLFLMIYYWAVNAGRLARIEGYIFARPTGIFLWFIVIAANLSGHVFGSGIGGFFIGFALSLMFYNTKNYSNEQK